MPSRSSRISSCSSCIALRVAFSACSIETIRADFSSPRMNDSACPWASPNPAVAPAAAIVDSTHPRPRLAIRQNAAATRPQRQRGNGSGWSFVSRRMQRAFFAHNRREATGGGTELSRGTIG
jgi:hypothetical protein